jgi:hypothetical protein
MISAGGQVAVEALAAGGAEGAIQRTAGLRRNTQRAAVVLGMNTVSTALPVADVEQPLAVPSSTACR